METPVGTSPYRSRPQEVYAARWRPPGGDLHERLRPGGRDLPFPSDGRRGSHWAATCVSCTGDSTRPVLAVPDRRALGVARAGQRPGRVARRLVVPRHRRLRHVAHPAPSERARRVRAHRASRHAPRHPPEPLRARRSRPVGLRGPALRVPGRHQRRHRGRPHRARLHPARPPPEPARAHLHDNWARQPSRSKCYRPAR